MSRPREEGKRGGTAARGDRARRVTAAAVVSAGGGGAGDRAGGGRAEEIAPSAGERKWGRRLGNGYG